MHYFQPPTEADFDDSDNNSDGSPPSPAASITDSIIDFAEVSAPLPIDRYFVHLITLRIGVRRISRLGGLSSIQRSDKNSQHVGSCKMLNTRKKDKICELKSYWKSTEFLAYLLILQTFPKCFACCFLKR